MLARSSRVLWRLHSLRRAACSALVQRYSVNASVEVRIANRFAPRGRAASPFPGCGESFSSKREELRGRDTVGHPGGQGLNPAGRAGMGESVEY